MGRCAKIQKKYLLRRKRQEYFKIASACAPAIFSGKIIFYSQFWKICGFSRIAFSREHLRGLFCTQKGCRTVCAAAFQVQ